MQNLEDIGELHRLLEYFIEGAESVGKFPVSEALTGDCDERNCLKLLVGTKLAREIHSTLAAGKDEVTEYDIGAETFGLLDGGFGTEGNFRLSAKDAQQIAEQLGEVAIVLDDKRIEFFWSDLFSEQLIFGTAWRRSTSKTHHWKNRAFQAHQDAVKSHRMSIFATKKATNVMSSHLVLNYNDTPPNMLYR